MPRRKARREPGRPTLLDKEVEDKLVEATRIGSPMTVAAAYVGIAERTFQDWMLRGHNEQQARLDGEDPDPVEQKYLDLFEKVTKARANAAVQSVVLLRKAAVGGIVTEETTRKYRDAEGELVTETTVKKTPPDWRASAWYLERQHRHHFGQKAELAVEHGGKVEIDAESTAARIHSNLQALIAASAAEEQEAMEALTDGHDVIEGQVLEVDPGAPERSNGG